MQLFSRNKAFAALSLGALAALGACGDDVTVPVAPAAPVVISISPPSATMNVGERLTFAVSIGGGSATAAPTLASCTSSNTAVITAAVAGSTCSVTAVAPGNATVTAAASTGQAAAAGVSVVAPPAAISGLSISPSATQLAVGGSVTLVPTVNRAASAVNVAYTYTSSAATIASVTAAGVVTAVAPGTATITVSAAGTGTGFTATTLTTAATVTVSDRSAGLTSLQVAPSTVTLSPGATQPITASAQGPQAASATITYGTSAPSVATVSTTGVITAVAAGTATITVTAQTAQSGAFAASSITGLVTVTVSPAAQVAITNITIGSTQNPIDISNVQDQIQVLLAVQPNGQTVTEANVWVCEPSETVAACATRSGTPAARQSFTASGSQSATVTLFINTAEFAEPNWTTGDDASVRHKNGLKTIVATLTTAQTAASTIASNSISQVNFNNPDGWTINWTAPANRANDVGNITWYGGPTTPDALTPSAKSGAGSFTVVPVIYTPNRTVVQAVLNLSTSCGGNITDRSRPFAGTYGTATRDTLAGVFNCTGAATSSSGMAPLVVSAVDNNNNGYTGTTATPAVARSIFNDFSNIANSTPGGFLQSLAYRPNYLYLPHDYAAPTITAFDIRGGTNSTASHVDSAWVNNDYIMAGANPLTTTSSANLRYRINDANVGLTSSNGAEIGAGAASRNTLFSVCAQPNGIPTTFTAPTTCSSPVATGGISATVRSMGLVEHATNFTNSAYFAQVAETDRLGNRATSVVYTWANAAAGTGATRTNTRAEANALGNTATSGAVFGVDTLPPQIVAIPNTGAQAISGFARTDADSIYASTASALGGTQTADGTVFGVRFTDTRSGFFNCTATNCPAAAGQRGGSYQITRRIPTIPTSAANGITTSSLVNAATSATFTANSAINATPTAFDATIQEFSTPIFGTAARNTASPAISPAIGVGVDGYYTFSGTLVDRAGNTTTIPSRTVAIDNSTPTVTGLVPPASMTGGTPAAFTIYGTDNLEAIGGDLSIRYPGWAAEPIRFFRVGPTATTGFPLWHNPFAVLTDNTLTALVGAGMTSASGTLSTPIPFIQQLLTVGAGNVVPVAAAAGSNKPDQATGRLYDIRATSSRTFTDAGSSAPFTANLAAIAIPNTTKDWQTALGATATWQAFSSAATPIEFRVTTSSSITNPPFARVHIVRLSGGEWHYMGDMQEQQFLDQGGNRFWRYTFAGGAAMTQGGGASVAALAGGDVIRAIGVDANGNALSTANVTFGQANALVAGTTVTSSIAFNAAAPFTTLANADPAIVTALGVSANTNGANLVASCSTTSTLVTLSVGAGNTCTITPAGVVAANTNVTITFTVTGSAAGFTTNSITRSITITRTP